MRGLTEHTMFPGGGSPLVVSPASGAPDLAEVVAAHRARIDERLLDHGAVLFRGFPVASVEEFARFGSALSPQALDYVYRSTPRSSVGEGVFTATEYPADQEIALHCENAYQREWPLKLALCCLVAPATRGETPLADLRRVTGAVGQEILDAFEQRQVRYIRHYRPHVDLPWEVVFQTSDRGELAEFCAAHGIEHSWLDATTLRTAQTAQGTARHPVTGERVLFNQAHLFHRSSLPPQIAASLAELFGVDRLPRDAVFGDGTDIPLAYLEAVRAAFRSASVQFPWQPGDVLLIDNMRMAHGRRPYTGERKVIATLLELYSGQGTEGTAARTHRLAER
ncbi:TauD/TfdA family dioxygenase [Catenulispora subtropica]|uniref:TauD/TfdA family dioxygenase n=1 Tax=Catenulispora subtropica TaxID=450798 RepID=A0ABP5ENC5_9ACTN